MTSILKARRKHGVALVAATMALGLTACGSDDDGTPAAAATQATTTASAAADAAPYSGAETKLPEGWPKPTKKDGFEFTIGFPNPGAAAPALAAEQEGVKEATEELGGTFVSTDAGFSVQKQVSDFQQLLDRKVDAIVLSALDPNSLTPLLAKAKSQGVPVFINDLPWKAGDPAYENVSGTVTSGTDRNSYELAQAAAKADPGGKFGIIGLAIPSPFLDYIATTERSWGEQFGLQFVDRLDAKQDAPEAGATAAGELLAKNPDITTIFAISDSLALGASTAARQAGRDVKILGSGGYKPAVEAVEKGQLLATAGVDNANIGRQWVYAAYNTLTKQHLPLAEQVVVPGNKLLTKDDTSGFTPVG